MPQASQVVHRAAVGMRIAKKGGVVRERNHGHWVVELCKFHCCSFNYLLLHFINYQHFPSPLRAHWERHNLPWGGAHTPPCCQLHTTEGLGGKRGAERLERQIPNSWSSTDTERGQAAPGRVSSRGGGHVLSPVGWQLHWSLERHFSKGSR